nr:hypothetical protein [Tanacetum cinerariifolium]
MDGDMSTKTRWKVEATLYYSRLTIYIRSNIPIKHKERGNWRRLEEELIHLYVPSSKTTATYKLEQHLDMADSGSMTSTAPLVKLNDLFIISEFRLKLTAGLEMNDINLFRIKIKVRY